MYQTCLKQEPQAKITLKLIQVKKKLWYLLTLKYSKENDQQHHIKYGEPYKYNVE